MYISGKHGSSSIYVMTDLKKKKKKNTHKKWIMQNLLYKSVFLN